MWCVGGAWGCLGVRWSVRQTGTFDKGALVRLGGAYHFPKEELEGDLFAGVERTKRVLGHLSRERNHVFHHGESCRSRAYDQLATVGRVGRHLYQAAHLQAFDDAPDGALIDRRRFHDVVERGALGVSDRAQRDKLSDGQL